MVSGIQSGQPKNRQPRDSVSKPGQVRRHTGLEVFLMELKPNNPKKVLGTQVCQLKPRELSAPPLIIITKAKPQHRFWHIKVGPTIVGEMTTALLMSSSVIWHLPPDCPRGDDTRNKHSNDALSQIVSGNGFHNKCGVKPNDRRIYVFKCPEMSKAPISERKLICYLCLAHIAPWWTILKIFFHLMYILGTSFVRFFEYCSKLTPWQILPVSIWHWLSQDVVLCHRLPFYLLMAMTISSIARCNLMAEWVREQIVFKLDGNWGPMPFVGSQQVGLL